MFKKLKENTVTLGYRKLPIGLPPTKYQRAKLNGFDITDKLSCIDGDIGERFDQENNPSLAWLTFKDGLIVVCQRVFIEKI